jgi:hypothetical protein
MRLAVACAVQLLAYSYLTAVISSVPAAFTAVRKSLYSSFEEATEVTFTAHSYSWLKPTERKDRRVEEVLVTISSQSR